jgi:predicted CoA-binding protein
VTPDELEKLYFGSKVIAVVGVSEDETKFGRIVYDRLKAAGFRVFPVNPKLSTVAGDKCYPYLSALPEKPEAVSVVVPPRATVEIAKEAARLGAKIVWMQPGAEHPDAVGVLEKAGIPVVHGGPCVLVALAKIKPRR